MNTIHSCPKLEEEYKYMASYFEISHGFINIEYATHQNVWHLKLPKLPKIQISHCPFCGEELIKATKDEINEFKKREKEIYDEE